MMPGTGGDLNTTLPMVLNIVGFLLCGYGCLSAIPFIIGFVFTMQANTMRNQGDMAGAMAKRKSAMLMAYIGFGLGFVLSVILGILRAVNG